MSEAAAERGAAPGLDDLRALIEDVRDPEIPLLTIADLGILRELSTNDGRVTVVITPTYSGCPAMRTIEQEIAAVLARAGVSAFAIETRLAPAWTTDWLSADGRRKLLEAGIAPPAESVGDKRRLRNAGGVVRCPQCGSADTETVSEFGSTPCKALHRCRACREPFDYFKCL